MNRLLDGRIPFFVAICLTATNVFLVWNFRFLPLGDYAIWLFVAKVLRALGDPASLYNAHYELLVVPVPNLTFTLFTVLASHVVSLEIAGKLFMTLLTILFPWSLWYSIRSMSPHTDPALGYLGFPFFFNMFMFGSQNYLLGLAILLFTCGYFLPRFHRFSSADWLVLGVVLLLNYFTHAMTFLLTLVVLISVAFSSTTRKWTTVGRVALSALPSTACLVWYLFSNPRLPGGPSSWGIGTIVRNACKPLMLFIKSFGVATPIPLSLCNGLWLLFLVVMAITLLKNSRLTKTFDRRFVPAAVICAFMILVMPSVALGVAQPGTRFGIPLLVFLALSMLQAGLSVRWKFLFLAFASLVTLYNFHQFRRVNDQSAAFYEDLTRHVNLADPFYVLRYDWSTEEAMRDRFSVSVDPLSLVPYYACLDRDCVCWIHETALVSLRPESGWYRPDISGATIHDFDTSIMNHMESLRRFPSLVVLGTGTEAESTIKEFERVGYQATLVRPLWTILRSD